MTTHRHIRSRLDPTSPAVGARLVRSAMDGRDMEDLVLADAEYFRRHAAECVRLAAEAGDPEQSCTYRALADAFETEARSLGPHGRRLVPG